jgi:CheY-like chemotaxis protein
MSKVLVVDDSPVDRQLAGKLLEKQSDATVIYATDGKEAMLAIAREKPDAVVTDLQMPGMNGLDLVLEIRMRHPHLPVVLMTAHGSEELALEALRRGAASYVPKRNLVTDLAGTLDGVIESSQGKQSRDRVMECLSRTESHFVLENDPALIPPLVNYLKDNIFRMSGSDDTGLIRVTIALREALLNAMEHGNLELDSGLRDKDTDSYHTLAFERRQQKPYSDRRVFVAARESQAEAMYVIRDEGPGFDPSKLPDPTDPANLERPCGRGMLLIRTFMSEVKYNDRGNEIVLIHRRD